VVRRPSVRTARPTRRARVHVRAGRRGMTLMEILVALAIIIGIMSISVPTLYNVLALEQHAVTRQLATTIAFLRDEATLRGVTFRLAFDLDAGTWKVQAGSPDATIFATPEEREAWERDIQDRMARYTQREIEEGAADEILDQTGRFDELPGVVLDTVQELPGGTRFAWIWTSQWEEPVTPSAVPPEDPADDKIVYLYIFPDGQLEAAVLRLVSEDDPDEGYSLVVEPLTGRIQMESEEIEPETLFAWLPLEAPELPE
jgi:prepilin-type N-terminal cleavage/methylation domain-containing protein